MKLTINQIEAGIRRDDGVVSFPTRDAADRIHTVELSPQAQNALIKLILGSPPVQSVSKPQRVLPLEKTGVMATTGNRIGLILVLDPGVALHCVLAKPAAAELAEQIRVTLEQDVPKQ